MKYAWSYSLACHSLGVGKLPLGGGVLGSLAMRSELRRRQKLKRPAPKRALHRGFSACCQRTTAGSEKLRTRQLRLPCSSRWPTLELGKPCESCPSLRYTAYNDRASSPPTTTTTRPDILNRPEIHFEHLHWGSGFSHVVHNRPTIWYVCWPHLHHYRSQS